MHHNPYYGAPAVTGPVYTAPPVVHPTKVCETHTFSTTIVPHIFPQHNTLVNHNLIQNQVYAQQTQSVLNTVSETTVPGIGPAPFVAGAATAPYAPSPLVAGAATAPYAPSPLAPYGPNSMVAGAATAPYGPNSMVAGAATGNMGPNSMVAGAATGNMGPNANPMVGGMFKK